MRVRYTMLESTRISKHNQPFRIIIQPPSSINARKGDVIDQGGPIFDIGELAEDEVRLIEEKNMGHFRTIIPGPILARFQLVC